MNDQEKSVAEVSDEITLKPHNITGSWDIHFIAQQDEEEHPFIMQQEPEFQPDEIPPNEIQKQISNVTG